MVGKPSKRNVALIVPEMGDEEWQAIHESIETGWIAQGPKVLAFERAFADRHHASHAIAVNNCTAALHLALLALDIGPGAEVIVPAFTWVATANAVLYCGATPVFVDIDSSFNIDPYKVAQVITPRTKALIAVHLFGLCADMDVLRAALPERVAIVEDAACAAGGAYHGRPAGTLGRIGAFSFHPRKSITTGEGGMLTTADATLAARMRALRNHGQSPLAPGAPPDAMPDVDVLGFNYRLTDIQAAIGLVQLAKLDRCIADRSKWAAFYSDALRPIDWIRLPEEPIDGVHAWQSYVIQLAADAPMTRGVLTQALADAGIATRPGTQAVPMLGYYRKRFALATDDFPCARDAAESSLAIPLHNRMNSGDYHYVAETLRRIARS